ncbi:MAG TPA: MFS transporter [Candidatus Acidoferrum sp.]|nr:MFS transporter [Candidatus Acidoferrum sp.]
MSFPAITARTATLLVACIGVLLAQVDTSVVNLAVHRIRDTFGADPAAVRWVVDSYNLTYAAAILSAGGLADILGRRRLFVLGTIVFTLGSIGCTVAPNDATLIAARAVTGIGAALEVPATLALLSVAFPEGPQRASALGIWASMNGLAFVVGPLAGGVLADALGWRSLFAIAVPIALLALALARRVEEPAIAGTRSLDLAGQLFAAVGLGALAFAGMAAGIRETKGALLWLVLACAAFAAFLACERTAKAPLVDLRLFRDRPFVAATFATMAMTFGMYGVLYLTPLALQTFGHASTTRAGIALLPMSLVFVVTSSASGRVVARIGGHAAIVSGMAAMGAGCLVLAFGGTQNTLALSLGLASTGLGMGLATGQLLGYAVSRAPGERAGTASGIGNAARMIGATLGVAIIGGSFALAHGGDLTPLRIGFASGGVVQLLGALVAFVGIRETRRDRSA